MQELLVLTDELYKASQQNNSPTAIDKVVCGKNDTAAFQIVLNNQGKKCRVTSGASPSLGTEIARTIYRIEVVCPYKHIIYTEKYLLDEQSVLRADILDTAPTADYDGNVCPVLWVDIPISKDVKDKEISVTVNVYAKVGAHNEQKLTSKRLSVFIYDTTLPKPEDYIHYLDLWQQNSSLAAYYGVGLWSDEHFTQIEAGIKTLAALGQKSLMVLLGDCPWQGWGCYLMQSTPANLYEYSIVKITKNTNGYEYDFSALDRYIDLCAKYHINGDISVYGLLGIWKMPMFPAEKIDHLENVLIRYLDTLDGCYKYMRSSLEIADYIHNVCAYFKQKKVFDKVYICGDEPADMTACRENMQFLQSIDKNIKFKLAIDHAEVLEKFTNELACCAASFPCTCNQYDFLMDYKKNKNGKLLYYVCNIPDKPNTVLKNQLFEARFLGTLTFTLGFDGFLRWAHYCWTTHPTDDIRYNNFGLPAGDICLVYPDKKGGVLLSLRYRALKRGIEDFELLKRLKNPLDAERAASIILKNTDFKTYMKDDKCANDGIFSTCSADYSNMREYILDILSKEGTK